MSVSIYTDVHVRRAVVAALRVRGVDVLTAQQDGAGELDDSSLLDRATTLRRVLFTQDADLLIEATKRQQAGVAFAGVVYAHQLRVTVGICVDDLELIAQVAKPEELRSRVIHLPLR